MEQRSFQLQGQWCKIHYPERPNGFAVFILGDGHHFVEQKDSFWTQHYGRAYLLEELKQEGYLVFYSHLFGKHWGSKRAVEFAVQLYHYICQKEIINHKIHILSEGMGVLVAKQLMERIPGQIRSMTLLQPCLSLKKYIRQEKKNKVFYKKLKQEMAAAHKVPLEQCEQIINDESLNILMNTNIPLQFIHILDHSRYQPQMELSRRINIVRKQKGKSIEIQYLLPEKRGMVGRKMIRFFKKNEKVL
ncbi:MAG: hydrolase [Bacillus sp. (in: Bacteria)]|nr:hydrolase [Bacillus sp. (in: firmicutes)]